MAKQGRPVRQQDDIAGFAARRKGANYQDAYRAAALRLKSLYSEYEHAPNAYRAFILVGICTALESHLKYFYAYATERYAGKPDLLHKLLRDVSVDISAMISVSTSTFQLSDVVAASISASTLETYLEKAGVFIAVIYGENKHNFPWDHQKFRKGTDDHWKKEIGLKLERLRGVFALRHRLVHETDVLDAHLSQATHDIDAKQVTQDALWLIGEFEKRYWNSEFDEKRNPQINRAMPDLVEDMDKQLRQAFNRIERDVDVPKRKAFQNSQASLLVPHQQGKLHGLALSGPTV